MVQLELATQDQEIICKRCVRYQAKLHECLSLVIRRAISNVENEKQFQSDALQLDTLNR